MFTIICNIFLLQAAFLSQNENQVKDQILTRFIDAFGEENLIDIWMKETERTSICKPELFKGIISKIKNVIYVINTKEFTTLKSLILSTNMTLSDAGYLFYETIIILNSVKRILDINKEQNFFKTYDMSYFNK
jgi:hypothetical protein